MTKQPPTSENLPPFFTICHTCHYPRHYQGHCRLCLKRSRTYRNQYCINGCTKPGPLLNTGNRGPHNPRTATAGRLCTHCSDKLHTWLTDIPNLYATLDTKLHGGLSAQYDGKTHKAGKLSHSPALANLFVVSLMDRRTLRDSDDKPGEPMYIPGVVTGWASLFAEEQELVSPTNTITEATNLMAAWWSTLVVQPWLDELWKDMHDIAALLHRSHGTERPREVGTCISIVGTTDDPHLCGRKLYALQGEAVQCPGCFRTYNGLELVKIADKRDQAERSVAG